MRIPRNLTLIFTMSALCLLYAVQARAEAVKFQMATGNNVGMWFGDVGGGAYRPPSGKYISWPQGSGNAMTLTVCNHSPHCIRDMDGDGISEDTCHTLCRGGYPWYGNSTLESYDELLALVESGVQMESWRSDYGAARQLNVVQVWSSKDPDDLADWPVQFREGRSPNGDPVLHGAETLATFLTDVWDDEAIPKVGVSSEVSAYFLNFGESNDMVYGHTFMRNMSEYLAWNKFMREAPGLLPEGFQGAAWDELMITFALYNFQFNDSGSGYGWHPAKEILAVTERADGMNSGFTNGHTPIFAHKMLRYPSFNGETMEFSNIHCGGWAVQYGFDNQLDPMQNRMPTGQTWRLGMDLPTEAYDNQINPYTGEVARGFPGDLRGTPRENEWAFGAHGTQNYVWYSMLHDVGLRDSLSMDYVFMFAYPKDPPLTLPPNEISSIGDPATMEQFEPIEHMADVAQMVFDGGYIVPETPAPPPLTIVPGDRKVTITWSDLNLNQPDAYYAFLEREGLNPEGYYREYDFEGFRLYRSYSGPNDNHSELIWEGGISTGDLQFYYVDNIDDDELRRMHNGQKVWYALVPYDKNYDPVTGDEFSLPVEGSGKEWYGKTQKGLYSVIPRSDASNFRTASAGSARFIPIANTDPVYEETAMLSGDGSGHLTEPVKYLAPPMEVSVVPVVDERITQDKTVSITATRLAFGYFDGDTWLPYAKLYVETSDSEGLTSDELGPVHLRDRFTTIYDQTLVSSGQMSSDGIDYAVTVEFSELLQGDWRNTLHYDIKTGSYNGAEFYIPSVRGKYWGITPCNASAVRSATIEGTWKDAGNGNLTLEMHDVTHDQPVPFAPYQDDLGWGFMLKSVFGSEWMRETGAYWDDMAENPRDERTVKMVDKIPADNTESIAIWVNGIIWIMDGEDGIAMPQAGTVFTFDHCFGRWNLDQTEFTQTADPFFWPGDRWEVDLDASSMNPDDADLSKIKVVPNPYIATSFLDIGDASRRIEFVNLPARCTIRIYTLSGNLVNVLNHIGANRFGWGNYQDYDELDLNSQPKTYTGWDNHGGTEPWNMLNRFGQRVASGCYFYHVTDVRGETQTGAFYIIN